MSTYSILVPFTSPRGEQILPFAALAQWSRAHRLWQGQGTASDPHQTFTVAAANGFRVPAGIGVTLMPFRHPFEAALQARTMAMTVGHPIVAGFGPGAVDLQRRMLGAPYASQLGAVRDYVTIVRALLETGIVEHQGEFFSCDCMLPTVPGPPIEIGLGVLRPAMARLAGEVADVAITWLTPAKYLAEVVVPALRAGAEAAGRPMPKLVAMVPFALSGPDRTPAELALASNSGHMALPHYRDMLNRSGIDYDFADPIGAGNAVVDGRAFLFGEAKEVVAQLDEFREAGVDDIVLNATGVWSKFGSRVALSEIETILSEVTS